ncbi:MAG TPA: EVE domain-containing protein [Fibrobacteria bacterium]|nr:EVE domain-containing protein [Fibrobacteria bacterium]
MAKKYWLMKTEPDVFGIRDLKKRPGKREHWDGVRNYQARNHMRDGMSVGDEVLFYHSSADVIGVAGVASIAKAAYPDPSALDPKSKYHDPKATAEKNPWVMVDVKFVSEFPRVVTLDEMKSAPGLENMLVTKRGMRLSVQPVTPEEFAIVLKLAKA